MRHVPRKPVIFVAAIALDALVGELPNAIHPVALFGRLMGTLERRLAGRGASFVGGILFTLAGVGLGTVAGLAAECAARAMRGVGVVLATAVLKQAFALRSLLEHVEEVERPLACGRLDEAKRAVGRIVGRPLEDLDSPLVASAAVESLFENLSDGVIGAWWWYVAAGLPGALAYRAANTMDAMVGYPWRGRFGTPSARLDDLLNLVPARLTAAAIAAAGRVAARDVRAAATEARRLRSPNAGWPMAMGARAIGVRLEKRGKYVLNPNAPPPSPEDIRRGRAVALRAAALAAFGCLAALAWRGDR
jgi:adenosylcobinamide-phosphate synthase